MVELFSAFALLGLVGVLCWLIADSDDDNGGGGLMQPRTRPELVPVRVSHRTPLF
jgi:hypothetical protein